MADGKIIHTVNVPADKDMIACPKCGKTDYSIRPIAKKVFCNGCGIDITTLVSEWKKKDQELPCKKGRRLNG